MEARTLMRERRPSGGEKKLEIQGWIYRGGGVQKKSNSEIWHNFQGVACFEVKLKLRIQCPYRRKLRDSRVIIFKICKIWYGKLRESDAIAFTTY
jgi:hypothetical protein